MRQLGAVGRKRFVVERLRGFGIEGERELIVPVDHPGANDALLYMLTSEVNFNDIWALTGIPVSPFDNHEEDVQVTGSGGVALVAATDRGLCAVRLGEEPAALES